MRDKQWEIIKNDPIKLEAYRKKKRERRRLRLKTDPDYRSKQYKISAKYRKEHPEYYQQYYKQYYNDNKDKFRDANVRNSKNIKISKMKYNSKVFIYKGERVKTNPMSMVRNLKCNKCNKGVGDKYINCNGKETIIRKLSLHHVNYYDQDKLKDTITLCNSCHAKVTWENRNKSDINEKRNCKYCSKEFLITSSASHNKAYCNSKCRNNSDNERARKRYKDKKIIELYKNQLYNIDPYEENEGTFRKHKLKNKMMEIGRGYRLVPQTYELEET